VTSWRAPDIAADDRGQVLRGFGRALDFELPLAERGDHIRQAAIFASGKLLNGMF
jgi:hypothetical protein